MMKQGETPEIKKPCKNNIYRAFETTYVSVKQWGDDYIMPGIPPIPPPMPPISGIAGAGAS